MVAISVPFDPGKAQPPKFPQAQAFWYEWLLCTNPGEKKFREDPEHSEKRSGMLGVRKDGTRNEELAAAKKSWKGKDFEDVVLHSYRSRWGHADLDPKYARQQTQFESTKTLSTPTMLLHGEQDSCELVETTEGAERHFSSAYQRILLAGVGHFPQRETPNEIAAFTVKHLRQKS